MNDNASIQAVVAQYADSRPHFTADQLADYIAIEGHTDSVLAAAVRAYAETL